MSCRMEYAKELMKHIPVHSYGACLHNQDFPKNASRDFSRDAYTTKCVPLCYWML